MGDLLQNTRLASPVWLAGLLLIPLVVVVLYGSLARQTPTKRFVSLVLRALVLVLLVLALCSPVTVRPNHVPWAVLLVDRSDSLAPESIENARRFVGESLRKTDSNQVVVMPFAATPGTPSIGVWPDSVSLDRSATDLAAAFRAVDSISRPYGPSRVILLSDGNSTVPSDVLSAATALQAPIDAIPLPVRPGPDAWIESLSAPSEVRPGNLVPLQVVLRSDHEAHVNVQVTHEGKELGRQKGVVADGRLAMTFELELGIGPRDIYRVSLEATPDSCEDNNTSEIAVWHGAPARALLIGREVTRFTQLTNVLRREHFEVETRTTGRFPANFRELSRFDLIVLADVPATDFSPEQLDAIERYVHDDAGGLLVFGGRESLTAGDYRDSPLEKVLPLTCEYDVQAKRPSLAMVLAIDQSGSMEDGDAIELAKTAVRRTVDMLDAEDQLGVIAFQDTTQWIVPLQPCDNKARVLTEVGKLQAGGGTNMHPAIAKAHLALHEAYADLKHIIVLTDGISYPGDFDTLASEVAASGITISTVAVGSEAAEPLLKSIAELGGGNFHHCKNASEIPDIFVRETAKAARMGIREGPFIPQVDVDLPLIASLPDKKPPALLGYVQTKAKPNADVGMVSESGDPLLAWWSFGRGHAAVFTSDLRGDWSRPWWVWDGLEPLWSGLAKETVRPANVDGYQLTCTRQGDTSRVFFDAVLYPGRFQNDAEVVLDAISFGGSKRRTVMPLVAPGQYAVQVPTPEEDTYDFQATCEVGGETVFTGRCSACPVYPIETIPRKTNVTFLKELAAATGGRFDPPPDELFPRDPAPSTETRALWHYLLLLSLIVYLVELTLRRMWPSVYQPRIRGR